MKKNRVRKTELLFHLEHRTSAGHSCRRQMVLQCKKSSYDRHSYRRNRAYDDYSKGSLKRLRPLTQLLDPNKNTFFLLLDTVTSGFSITFSEQLQYKYHFTLTYLLKCSKGRLEIHYSLDLTHSSHIQ